MTKRLVFAFIFIMLMIFSRFNYALQVLPLSLQTATNLPVPATMDKPRVSPLTKLGSEFHNSIALLQNRFRIDYEVDEITMVFFRKFGSIPIVLVQPDGSKIFQSTADGKDISWFDTATYDMIKIKNPAIGPWQAVGDILPESRVMVISDLALHVDKLPDVIFSGEIIKLTAYLTNNGIPIDYTAFRDVVELTIALTSTNNPEYNNFGAGTEIVATFEDNGKGMDELPLDGVFTGQFNLSIPDGEWIPNYSVATPMYSREQIDPNIMLFPNPIKIAVEIDDGKGGYHQLKVDAEREHIDISSLLIDGKVRYPNGDIQNFSINEMSNEVRMHEIVNFDFGVHQVKLTAFANTHDGREVILDVPEYSFVVEEIVPEVVVDPDKSVTGQPGDNSELAENMDIPPVEDGMSTTALISWIIGLNSLLVLLGMGLIWLMTSKTKINFSFFKKTKGEQVLVDKTDKQPNLFARLFKRKSKDPAPVAEDKKQSAKSTQETDTGFIDLAMPKE